MPSLSWPPATTALDEVRRSLAAQAGHPDQATTITHTRWALLNNPPELTGEQRTTLAAIAKDNGALYRASLRKEPLRIIFQADWPTSPKADSAHHSPDNYEQLPTAMISYPQ
jgi:hypothetical protein